MAETSRVALIGSFKQHYSHVLGAHDTFRSAGWTVTSPLGDPIIEEGIDFVRFGSDPPDWDNPMVQTVALHRILRADVVYVLAPGGYVGRTTCYEIGRIIQADRPIYFSEQPDDLPIDVPDDNVVSPQRLVDLAVAGRVAPLYANAQGGNAGLERDLVSGRYSDA